MMPAVNTTQQKLAALQEKFIKQLPKRLAEAQTHFETLQQDPNNAKALSELHRFFHSLKGTSRSFGLENLANVILPGDEIVNQFTQTPLSPPENWRTVVTESLQQAAKIIIDLSDPEQAAELSMELNLSYSLPPQEENSPLLKHQQLIYICDDDLLFCAQLATQLNCFGFDCRTYNTTDSLVEATTTVAKPSAIIMDINFPEGKGAGIETLKQIYQKVGHHIPAIFLSARNDFEARLHSVQIGGDAYFQKPTNALDIVAVLDELTCKTQPEPLRVLIIDDDQEVAHYHSIILSHAGVITDTLSTPEKTLQVLNEFRPDLVLLDMYMPCCNGRDLAKMIRQLPEYISLPIVYLSSETDAKKQFSAMRIGAEGFLTKPVKPDELVSAVVIRAERMRILRALMAKDSLTGLFNHTTTTAMLNSALQTAKRENQPLSFAMIDIDHFKKVNDTYGHPEGDKILLAISRLFQQRLRSSDLVGRYGGEEFAIILPNTPLKEALTILNQLRTDFANVVFNTHHDSFSCSFSAGVSCYPCLDSPAKIRAQADQFLYQAKANGRNQVIGDLQEPKK